MIALVYVLLYILLFSRTLTNFVIGAHVRYLMPDIILLGFNILSFLRRPLSDEKDRRFVLLLAGLALQTLLIAVAFMVQPDQTDAILSRGINTFYNLRNEWTAFFLILGLLGHDLVRSSSYCIIHPPGLQEILERPLNRPCGFYLVRIR